MSKMENTFLWGSKEVVENQGYTKEEIDNMLKTNIENKSGNLIFSLPVKLNSNIKIYKPEDATLNVGTSYNLVKNCDLLLNFFVGRKSTDGHWYYGGPSDLGYVIVKRGPNKPPYKENTVAFQLKEKAGFTNEISLTIMYTEKAV